MFSSLSGIVGLSGQANYAAVNTFLDAFVKYRHRLHLSASVLDISIAEDIGLVSQNTAILKRFQAMTAQTISEQALLDTLQITITQGGIAPQPLSPDGIINQNQLIIGLGSRSSVDDPQSRYP